MINLNIKETDGIAIGDIMKELKALAKKHVSAGFMDGDMHSSGMTTAELAWKLENAFPAENSKGEIYFVPGFYLMATVAHTNKPNKGKANKLVGDVWSSVMNTQVNDKAMEELGRYYKNAIYNTMGKAPPLRDNSEVTIELKDGRNTPLVDTGELQESVKYKTYNSAG